MNIWNNAAASNTSDAGNLTGLYACRAERRRALRGKMRRSRLPALGAVSGALLMATGGQAWANGLVNGQVTAGSAAISQTATTTQITQESSKVVINWDQFSIAGNESVNFSQPTSNSVALSRVVGEDPSQILGTLTANGQIFLVNPNGVVFGTDAVVDVSGLVASTLDIADDDFMEGNNVFSGEGGSVTNLGSINANGGYVGLVGAQVSNEGSISAEGGTVGLAAGDRVSMDFDGDGLVTFQVDGAAVDASASNKGIISANGGTVIMTAKTAGDLMATVVSNEGVIEANSMVERDGKIILVAADEVNNTGDIGWENNHGKVVGDAGTVVNTGTLTSEGGSVVMAGTRVGHSGTVDASGGGSVLLASTEQTHVSKGATIITSGSVAGDAGNAIVWSDGYTYFGGHVDAQGGTEAGDGGEIEVSGYENLEYRGSVNALATNGETGLLLLDPTTITIVGGTSDGSDNDATLGNSSADILNDVAESNTLGTYTFGDVIGGANATVYESEIEGTTGTANIILEAKDYISVSGLFTAAGGIHLTVPTNVNLTLRTRNDGTASDATLGNRGIDLTTSGNHGSSFAVGTSGTGSILIDGGVDTPAAGNRQDGVQVTVGALYSASTIDIRSAGNITVSNTVQSTGAAVSLDAFGATTGALLITGPISGVGTVTLEGRTLNLDGGSASAAGGTVQLYTHSDTGTIGLGTGAGTYSVSNTELSNITANMVVVGAAGTQSGQITARGASTNDNNVTLNSTTGGVALDDGAGTAALNAGTGSIVINSGTGGVTANANIATEELNAGGGVTIVSGGAVGASGAQIQFADGQGNVNVTTTATGANGNIYLGGVGSLTVVKLDTNGTNGAPNAQTVYVTAGGDGTLTYTNAGNDDLDSDSLTLGDTGGATDVVNLNAALAFVGSFTVNADTDATIAGVTTSVGAIDLNFDTGADSASTPTITGTLSSAGAITIDGQGTNDTLNANNAGMTAATTLDINTFGLVNLGAFTYQTTAGDLDIQTGITGITLTGANGATTIIDGNGDANTVLLAAITDTNNPNLTVNTEGDVNITSADMGTGTLAINVDGGVAGVKTGTFVRFLRAQSQSQVLAATIPWPSRARLKVVSVGSLLPAEPSSWLVM